MNREIKFRGRDFTGRWIYGGYTYDSVDNDHIITYVTDSGELNGVIVETETVGQFTGLTDKNGVKIFEGDVVKWDDVSGGKYWRIAVTKINPDLQFDCFGISEYMGIENSSQHCFRYGTFIYKDTNNHLEIIGNIHDNHELIK